ncbi:hypothetical protein Tco_0813532 [Tanacetum coccineum]
MSKLSFIILKTRVKSDIGGVFCDDDAMTIPFAYHTRLTNKEPVNSLNESEGIIPDSVCDMPLCNNPTPLKAFKDHYEIVIDSNDDSSLSDDDSYENIEYVDASPPDAEIVSLEVVENVISEVGGIDTDILLTIKDDIPFIEPELGNLTMDVVEDIFPTREPRVHVPNVLPTHPTLDTNFILFNVEPLFAYIVWIFLPFLTYPVAPPYLLSCGNEDTIFDPGISIYHSFMPDVSHRSRTFIKFNVYSNHLNESLMEILSSTCPHGTNDSAVE